MKIFFLFILLIFVFGINSGCDNPVNTKTINLIPPSPISPPDGTTYVDLEATFVWNGQCNRLEIDYTPSFNPPVFSKTVAGTEYKLPAGVLAYNTIYFWRCGLASGTTVVWSTQTFSFKTEPKP